MDGTLFGASNAVAQRQVSNSSIYSISCLPSRIQMLWAATFCSGFVWFYRFFDELAESGEN